MKELLERHYAATVKRGKITSKTVINDFIAKMHEEDTEMINEKAGYDMIVENNFIQETVDSIMVRINMLKKLNKDFYEELEKNVIYQETRKD